MPARNTVIIREITAPAEWQAMYALVKQQNRETTKKEFNALLAAMRAKGYRCAGAFQRDRGEALVGIMGFWIGHRFWCRKYLDLDNVIVDQAHRRRGIGAKLLRWVEDIARKENCQLIGLDSYTTAHDAHRFYFREGYAILGYHFTKHL